MTAGLIEAFNLKVETIKEPIMAKENREKAAELHGATAASHKAAADKHWIGNHDEARAESSKAHSHFEAAHKASSDAHGKSSSNAKR